MQKRGVLHVKSAVIVKLMAARVQHVSAKKNALGMEIAQQSVNLVMVGTKVRCTQRMSSAVRTCVWRNLSRQGMSWQKTLERQGRTE